MKKEHLEILQQGVEVWNAWRETGQGWPRPQLEDANLQGGNFRGADLSGANLNGANLNGADLQDVDLQRASLHDAQLHDSNLQRTDLRGAHLHNVDFQRADLRGAQLQGAILQGGDLGGAHLQRANLQDVDLQDANLQGAHLGSPQQAMMLDLRSAKWERVRVDEQSDLDHGHDPEDESYWVIRTGNETLQEALYRRLAEQSFDDISIEFTRAVWRELHLVEIGLREALGENRFAVRKADDLLAVTFRSSEDLQRGLEAVVVQLAALETVEPQRVKSIAVRPPEGEVVVFEREEMNLEAVARELQEIKRRLPADLDDRLAPALDDNEATAAKLWDRIPVLNLFTHRFEKWLASDRTRGVTQHRVDPLQIFRWAKERFEMVHKQRPLPRSVPRAEQRALPPGDDPQS